MKLFKKLGWGSAIVLPLAFLSLFFAWPVGAMLLRGISASTHTAQNTFFGGLFFLLGEAHTWRILWQTLWMALAGTLLSVFFGLFGAYVLYQLDFVGRRALRAIITVPFVLPTVVVGIAFRALLGGSLSFLGLSETPTAVVLAMVFFNFSLIVRTVGVMWANLDQRTVQAARSLGASPLKAFYTITLPQLMPAIAAAAGLVFLYCSTAYGIVRTLGNPGYGTLETEIYIQTVTFFDLDRAAMLSLLQFAIVTLALIFTARLSAYMDTALKVTSKFARRLTRNDLLPLMITFLIATFIIVPLGSLIVESFHVKGQWGLENYRYLSTAGAGFSGGTSVVEALNHSVKIALDATVIAIAIGVPLALVLSRRVTGNFAKAQRALDAFVLFPLGISSVTVGFGFLITFSAHGFGTSPFLVPLAQAVVALPLVVRSLVPLLRAIDPRMREAAASLGASPWRVIYTIDFPFLLRGLGLAVGFAFAISLGEFGATSFVANPDYQTLPLVIVKLLSRPGVNNYGMALAGAVVLGLATASVIMLAEFIGSYDEIKGRMQMRKVGVQ